MNFTKMISILLIVCMALGLFACSSVENITQSTANPTAETQIKSPESYIPEAAIYTGEFTYDLEKYLKENGYENKNYIVSPTSYRAALCLAIAGAENGTKERLIKAAGFSSVENANEWYANLMSSIDNFRKLSDNNNESDSFGSHYDVAFEMANAIWNNSDKRANFKESYINYVKSHYDSEASSIPGNELMNAINSWCSEKTHGMIKEIVGDGVKECAAILANALYIKDAWHEAFRSDGDKIFHTTNSGDVTKAFITNTYDYEYYEDEDTRLVIVPMHGNKCFVVVIGNTDNILNKIKAAEYHNVMISMPKIDIETSLKEKELVHFIEKRGAGDATNIAYADFSGLYNETGTWYIDDIIQKAKIRTDEKGLEAAAVTVVAICDGAIIEDPKKPIEFIADVPFSFYIVDTYNSMNEILFFGQMVE